MIELTNYIDNDPSDRRKVSVMVSEIESAGECDPRRGGGCILRLKSGRQITVYETPQRVKAMVNEFIERQAQWAHKD